MAVPVPDVCLGDDEPPPRFDHFPSAPEELSRGGTKQVDGVVGRQDRLTGAQLGGSGPSGGMVGEGGNYAGVDKSMLLTEPGENRQLGLQPIGAHSDQLDT